MATLTEALAEREPSAKATEPAPPTPMRERILGAIRQYGPSAALGMLPAAVAATPLGLPALKMARQIAPKIFERLEASPRTFLFDAQPAALKLAGPSTLVQPGALFSGRESAHVPWYTDINAPAVPEPLLHELGHAVGLERGYARQGIGIGPRDVDRALRAETFYPAAEHHDILTDPKIRDILRHEVTQRDPRLLDYYAFRRLDSSPADALGELLTETWANRVLRRAGIPSRGWDFGVPKSWTASAKAARITYGGETEAIRETGTVPGVAEALADYLAVLNAKYPVK